MATLSLSSQLGTQIQLLEQIVNTGGLDLDGTHFANVDEFITNQSLMVSEVLQLSSAAVRIGYTGDDETFELAFTGSGIGPVSSMAELQDALNTGMATGSIDQITLSRTAGVTTTLLQVNVTPGGYSLTSGVDELSVTGSVPATLEDLFDIVNMLEAFDPATLSALTAAERADYFNALADYGITGLEIVSDGTTLGSLDVTPTSLTLTIGGMEMALTGVFPADMGQLMTVVYDLMLLGQAGLPLDLDALAGLDIDTMTMTAPNGTTLMTITGPITDDFSLLFTAMTLDGVVRNPVDDIIVGEVDMGLYFQHYNQGTADPGAVIFGSISAVSGDTVYGGNADDYIFGLEGDDLLHGGWGYDLVSGGLGKDTIFGDSGNDTLDGGAGVDTLYLGQYGDTRSKTVNLSITTRQFTGEGFDIVTNFENVIGAWGADRLIGDSGKNMLSGGEGDDTLRGGGGKDSLVGGFGDDVLEGGNGDDTLAGGNGMDRFIFSLASGSDRITGFANGQDRLVIKGISFDAVGVADAGADTVLTFGSSTVRLVNFDHLLIGAEDFLF